MNTSYLVCLFHTQKQHYIYAKSEANHLLLSLQTYLTDVGDQSSHLTVGKKSNNHVSQNI